MVRAAFEDLCDTVPTEPGFHTMAAFLAILDDEMLHALEHLSAALDLEGTPHLRARLLLTRSRVHEVLGHRDLARDDRTEIGGIDDPGADSARAQAAAEARRPMTRRRLRLMSPDVMLLDLHA